ncbi:MAG: hypothetical protein AABX30_00590 [Nanoarchaeota archaeon]
MDEKLIGEVSNFFEHVGVIAIKLSDVLKIGDKIRIIGGETDFTESIKSMQLQHKNIDKAKKGDEVGIKVSGRARKGYKVYRV